MHKFAKTLAATLVAAAGLAAVMPAAQAQAGYPERAVTVVVPFPPGGASDAIARVMTQHMAEKMGQSFVIDNKPGATGTIGAAQVLRSPADGYTLLFSSLGTFVIAPHLLKGVPYDATKDFDYITVPVQAPNVLVTGPAQSAKTLAEVLALLKANPGKVSFASSGNGSSDHLSAEMFWQQSGTQGVHVPYKGGGPAINDLLGGQVDFSFQNVNSVLQHIKAGKLRPIVVTGDKRSPVLPDVPTLAEAGVRGAEVYSWQGFAGPKNLPPAVKKKLSDAAVAAMNDPAIRKRMEDQGLEVVANTPEQMAAFQLREYNRWKQLIEARKISAD
jgi:tripartite-type tricarboxylate transporter receptor subunit TctC